MFTLYDEQTMSASDHKLDTFDLKGSLYCIIELQLHVDFEPNVS